MEKEASDTKADRTCPALGAYLQQPISVYFPVAQLPHYIRPLTAVENANIERFAPEIATARDHFRLFRIFNANYRELVTEISKALHVGELSDDEKIQFDRVLLNTLTSGTAIRDHFFDVLRC
jgi:hypothetical protein